MVFITSPRERASAVFVRALVTAVAVAHLGVPFAVAQAPCFEDPVTYGAPIGYEIAFGDLNNDGLDDLAVGESWGGSVHIRLRNADGSFGDAAAYPSCPQNTPVAFADFDGDGNQDLAVRRIHNADQFGVHYGDGTGALGPYVLVEQGVNTYNVLVVDLDADGLPDLVRGSPPAQAFLSTGSGFAAYAEGIWNTGLHYVLAVADMNLDGSLDVVEWVESAQEVVVHACDESWNVASSEVMGPYVVGQPWDRSLAVEDLDGDGWPDLVFGNGDGYQLAHGGPGAYVLEPVSTASDVVTGLTTLDYDRDGDLDLATVHNTGGFAIVVNEGGSFGTYHDFTTSVTWIQSAQTVDYDLDGVMDLALHGHTSGLEFRVNCTPKAVWSDLGQSLAGSTTPALAGAGTLEGGTPVSLSLSDAPPFTLAYLVIGLSELNAAFKTGTLVPYHDILLALSVDGFGEIDFAFPWPAGVPTEVSTWYQYWIVDTGAPEGFASSNALQGTTP